MQRFVSCISVDLLLVETCFNLSKERINVIVCLNIDYCLEIIINLPPVLCSAKCFILVFQFDLLFLETCFRVLYSSLGYVANPSFLLLAK